MSSKKIGRRETMTIMGAAGAAVAFGCGDSPTSPSTSSISTSTNSTNAACTVTPTETVGPYPSLTDLFRSDIRENKQGTVLTLYPGWYQGRATHIHAEVTINGVSRKVTQIAFPESVNNTVHGSGVYAGRGTNPISNAADGIFADSLSSELVTPTGSTSSGYAATFQIALAV